MESVDEAVRFVQLVTKPGHPAPGNHRGMALNSPCAAFGRFDLLGYFVDVGVQGMQQLPRLRRVGVVDHARIIAPTQTIRSPRTDRRPPARVR
jgi:hypothetical protein